MNPKMLGFVEMFIQEYFDDACCSACIFFYNNSTNSGECRRRAPTMESDMGGAVWIRVDETHWCGDGMWEI